jgi:zinc transporter, ZIP family
MGYVLTVVSFFAGIALIAIIDKLIPSYENPHEMNVQQKIKDSTDEQKRKLMRMGLFSALAIGIHNFPEGLATFMSGLTNPALGVSIAVAVAIHNIPEGLAVSAPIFYATKSRKKAFVLSFLSGFAEPIGALIGYFVLRSIFNETTFGIIFASVAGIMVYISLDELLPTAEEYGEHHLAIGGLIVGMFIMAVSLLLFA